MDEARFHDEMRRYWDEIARGEPATPGNLDPELAATIQRVHALQDVPAPTAIYVKRLREDLMHAASTPLTLTPKASNNGRSPSHLFQRSVPPIARPARRSWALTQLLTAALVVATLVVAFQVVRLPRGAPPNDQPGGLPALIAPATLSTPETTPETVPEDDIVLQATLETLGEMPSSRAQHELALARYRLAPGAEQPVGKQEDTGVGIELFTVETGQVTVEADAPVLVTRAEATAAAPSPVPAGTAIVLEVGDQLYAPSGVSFRRRNDGSDPAVLLDFSLSSVGDTYFDQALPPGVTDDAGFPYKLLSEFPAVPAEATVHRRTLEPGAELAVRDIPGLEMVYVDAGELDLVFDKGGTLGTPERVRTLSAGNGTEVFGRTPERAVLANRSTEPLILLTAPSSRRVPPRQRPKRRRPTPGIGSARLDEATGGRIPVLCSDRHQHQPVPPYL